SDPSDLAERIEQKKREREAEREKERHAQKDREKDKVGKDKIKGKEPPGPAGKVAGKKGDNRHILVARVAVDITELFLGEMNVQAE
ncbi:hypothetical protein HK097_003117, partial [Rhizophlyctis rosea]